MAGPNVNIGDRMVGQDGIASFYTGSGWTSNAPGTAGNPLRPTGNTISDPWAGLENGQFNAQGYGAVPPQVTAAMGAQPGVTGQNPYNSPLGANNPFNPNSPGYNSTQSPVTGAGGTGANPYNSPLAINSPFNPNSPGYNAGQNPAGTSSPNTPPPTTGMGAGSPAGTSADPGGGYFMSLTPGMSQPVMAPTFGTFYGQRLNDFQSPFMTPAAWAAGIVGHGGSEAAMATPAAQWARDYVALHPDDPEVSQRGGAEQFIAYYNQPQFALSNIRPDLAAVSNGWGSGGTGAWSGFNDTGNRLLTNPGDPMRQPAFDASPEQVLNSLRLNGVAPGSAAYNSNMGTANSNLGRLNAPSYTGTQPITTGMPPQMSSPQAPTSSGTTTSTPQASGTGTGTGTGNQDLLAYIRQLMQGFGSSQVTTTPLGYTQYQPQNSSLGLTQEDLLTLLASVMGNPSAQRNNFWNL